MHEAFSKETIERKAALVAVMATRGINTITVSYSGGGDSGQIDDVTIAAANDDALVGAKVAYDGELTPVRDFAEEFTDHLISTFHSGYENNDGGSGTVVITRTGADAGTVTWEHSDNYIATEETSYEL